MPQSSSENKSVAFEWYRNLSPDVVVDVGPGVGTYSDLLRPLKRGHWVGVEVWAPYVTNYNLEQKYDRVVVSDIRYADLPRISDTPDLVIAGDVLEHLSKEDCEDTISRLQGWSRNLIVSLPIVHYPQGAYKGNWFETHHYHWNYEEMLETLGPGVVDSVRGSELGYFLWSGDV